MHKSAAILFALLIGHTINSLGQKKQDYSTYHQQMIRADQYIIDGRYPEALTIMDDIFQHYDFIFLRDYQIAAQVAVLENNRSKAFEYLRAGMADGWTLTEIKKNRLFKKLVNDKQWRVLKLQYAALNKKYKGRLDTTAQLEVKQMFLNDQKLDIALMKIQGDKAQDDFLMSHFVPQNERQMKRLGQLLLQKGYPGEKLIGNAVWTSVLLSHHNSVSPIYVQRDTLYPMLKPLLLKAVHAGEMSPGEFAIIDDWRITIKSDHKERSYGYLNLLRPKDWPMSNKLRKAIGLPSAELRNQLVEVQRKTGIDFYLEGTAWVKGKL